MITDPIEFSTRVFDATYAIRTIALDQPTADEYAMLVELALTGQLSVEHARSTARFLAGLRAMRGAPVPLAFHFAEGAERAQA